MHTWTDEESYPNITIHHDGDPSPDSEVIILRKERGSGQVWESEVPYGALKGFVLDMLRDKLIGTLESASDEELLKILLRF